MEIDKFNICITGQDNLVAPSFRNCPEILSIPAAFDIFISESSFSIYSLFTGAKEKDLSFRLKSL
jgi:hypothetical protein